MIVYGKTFQTIMGTEKIMARTKEENQDNDQTANTFEICL